MKGFNIGPQPSSTSGSLPPVAEFIASLQQHQHDTGHHHDFFGSTLSGIFNSTPRKLHQHSSTVSSSQGSINDGIQNNHHRGIGRLVNYFILTTLFSIFFDDANNYNNIFRYVVIFICHYLLNIQYIIS